MSNPDLHSQRLSELSQCAYRLGLAFGAEAERAGEMARKIEYFQLFERCFFSVRVATALELRLWQAARTYRSDAGEREDLRVRADPPERERSDAQRDAEADRERDRESEPVSLPVLLKTLHGVVADAAALPGPEPAELPSLRELLAQVTSGAAPATPRPAAGSLRVRLAGSAGAAVTAVAPRPSPGPRAAPPGRRATGPPRR